MLIRLLDNEKNTTTGCMDKKKQKTGARRANILSCTVLQAQSPHSARLSKSQAQSSAESLSLTRSNHNSGNATARDTQPACGKSQSQHHARESSWIRSQQRLVSSLLNGRRVLRAKFQRGTGTMVLNIDLDQGGQVFIEPVVTNRGCHGLLVASPKETRHHK